MKTTVRQRLTEMLAGKVPEWAAAQVVGYGWDDAERWVKDAQGVAVLEGRLHEVLLNGVCELKRVAGLVPPNANLTSEQSALLAVARYEAAADMLHRARFWAAVTSERFAYVTRGHVVSPDSFHVYHRDKTSPTSVRLEVSGSQNPDFAAMLRDSGRRTCGSNAGA